MSLTVIQPPTIRELLKDPVMKSVILKTPRLPGGSRPAEPFRVWGIRHDSKWAGKNHPDYASAFAMVKKMLGQPEVYQDAVIICRPVGFRPPQSLHMPAGTSWCGHCRRPTVYRRTRSHAAMKKWPVISDDDVKRCYYCAGREQRVWHW